MTMSDLANGGFASGAQTHVTFGRHEPALTHFHRAIAHELELKRR